MEVSLTDYAKEQLKKVHALSSEYNGKTRQHSEKLLDLVGKHTEEIRELYASKDDHFSVEVGDLMILCYELLLESRQDADHIMDLCYDRYKKKLKGLIKDEQR